MSAKQSYAVYRYIRTNYKNNVPDVIIEMCLKYFNQVSTFQYKGKRFDYLMSFPVQRWIYLTPIRFSQDLLLQIAIIPNDVDQRNQQFSVLFNAKSMAQNIEQISICLQFDIDEIKSSIKGLTTFTHKELLDKNLFWCLKVDRVKLQRQSQFKIKFKIHSLIINYIKDKGLDNKQSILYYPSIDSIKLKQKICFIWNVEN